MPVVRVALRQLTRRTIGSFMVVPEAAVNEDDFAPRRENQIGASRKSGMMHSVTIANAMERSANHHFRFGVF